MRYSLLPVFTFLAATPALADAPRVVTDIAPVHSLVSMVMEGVGEPRLLLEAGASPHGYALRPSDARALQEADLVIWIGASLTPWLAEAQESLSADAVKMALIEQEGTRTFANRETIVFEHDEHDGHDHDHGHKDGHEHDHGHKDDHGHDHSHDHASGVDPHAWLDPANARVWLSAIATALSEKDAENANTYSENALRWQSIIVDLESEIATILGAGEISGFAVYHDAFQYFERAFGLRTMTSLSASDGAQPSAARAAVLGAAIRAGEVSCVFSEPQFADRAIRSVSDGSDTRVAVLDPLGAELTPGVDLYPQLLSDLAESTSKCR